MLFAKLNTPVTYAPLVVHPVWDLALGALRELSTDTSLGITELRGEAMFMNVHRYATKREQDCRFEGHRDHIDVQCIIRGGELVDWALKSDLRKSGEYDAEKDFQFYHEPDPMSLTRIHLSAGHFAVFFTEDGHRPQIHDGIEPEVLKAVVKIHRSLLNL